MEHDERAGNNDLCPADIFWFFKRNDRRAQAQSECDFQTIDDLGQVLGVSIDKIVEIQKAPDTEEMLQRRQAYLKSWERKTRKKMKTDEEEEKA